MKGRPVLWECLVLCAVCSTAQTAEKKKVSVTGKVEGQVIDSVERVVLAGVSVKLKRSASAKQEEKITEPNGSYQFSGLTAGRKYEVTYSKYQYLPETRLVTAPGKVDQELIKRKATAVYWKKQAHLMQAAAGGQSISDEAFAMVWEGFRKRPISVEGKAVVAHELKSIVDQKAWSNSKSFLIYTSADPEKLDELENVLYKNPNDTRVYTLDPLLLQDLKAAQAANFQQGGSVDIQRLDDKSSDKRQLELALPEAAVAHTTK